MTIEKPALEASTGTNEHNNSTVQVKGKESKVNFV
jgi:hypothetical protein